MTEDLFSRDEVLTGLPAKRARTLLFLIESKTAHLVAESRQAMQTFLTEEAAEEQEKAFWEAMSLGKDLPLRPSIQDLERYASDWASLSPDESRLRAALAQALSEKYRFTYGDVPGIQLVLGLDTEPVQQAFQQLYKRPLDDIFATRLALVDRLKWTAARFARGLENLPPFWTAFSLTLTETVGAGILALPIAVAEIGPLGGLIVLVVLAIVNMLTLAAMAEAVSRSGTIRYGSAYLGK